MNRSPNAFTLVELLVVITIIVILLALLIPAMDRAIGHAERARCSYNLQQFGLALMSHAMDRRAKLLYTPQTTWGQNVFGPHWVYIHQPTHANVPDLPFFTYEAIRDYVGGGVDVAEKYAGIGGIWKCPSNQFDTFNDAGWDYYNENAKSGGWFSGWYSYFGQSQMYESHLNRLSDLAQQKPGSSRVLMNDTIFSWGGGLWQFNHGTEGPSVLLNGPTFTPSYIAGANQLFADGSVHWSNAQGRTFDIRSFNDPLVRNYSGFGDTGFYLVP